MKKLSTVALGIFALSVGTAYAGGFGCNYGKHDLINADADEAVQSPAEADVNDPKLLALLQKQKAEAEKEQIATN